ncbi:unnamed protein product [Phaedon cochleariae]|uniref:CUB domain-containing protein n=1 Tax=Phaedon cochleariae TaxID=80249 RepID=A0A9P0GTT1_PHACE|nr:unnamed protein product [Phaedon cochleariae]
MSVSLCAKTMRQKVELILLLLYNLTSANKSSTCGEQPLNYTNGMIKFSSGPEETIRCNWSIAVPEKTITSISVIKSTVEKQSKLSSLCLTIKGSLKRYLQTCNLKLIKSTRLSVKEEIKVNISSARSRSDLWLTFASRNGTECPNSEFQCLDKSHCYNTSDIHSKYIICNDHSDKLATGKCDGFSTPCDYDSGICFNITQRCDGIVNCPRGEDELNCTSICPNLIKCPGEDKCIQKSNICDRNVDCSDHFDEKSCRYESSNSKILIVTTVFIVCSLFCIIFVCLVFRWVITKRDINRFLDNLPEIPLAPFQGPGEDDSDSASSDPFEAEFRQGGEIYECYMQSLKKKSHSSKAVQVGDIYPKFSHLEMDVENECIVLASLNVPRDMCVGLTISESSIESIKTLKSIRGKNENDSGSSVSDYDTGKPTAPLNSGEIEPCSVRSRSSPRVKFALILDANSDTKAASAVLENNRYPKLRAPIFEEFVKPKVSLAGGDFFILKKANSITESEASCNLDCKSYLENIPERNEAVKQFLQKNRSAPLPCSVNYMTRVAPSKSLGNIPKLTERDISCQMARIYSGSDRSSQWTDIEECDDTHHGSELTRKITVKTGVENLKKKNEMAKRICKKKIGYSVRM